MLGYFNVGRQLAFANYYIVKYLTEIELRFTKIVTIAIDNMLTRSGMFIALMRPSLSSKSTHP